MRSFKLIIEKHADGYVAYPIGMKGVVVGEGDTCEAALADVTSAMQFHIDTFGVDAVVGGDGDIEVFVAETSVHVA